MKTLQRTRLLFGLLLVGVGFLYLAASFFPEWNAALRQFFTWPVSLVGVAVALLVIGLFTGAAGMAVPACILAGLAAIFYYQTLTGNFASWSFAWTLIPAFVGAGMILARLMGGGSRFSAGHGFRLIGTSLALFLIFGYFLGGFTGFGPYWPVILIIIGAVMLLGGLLRPRS